MKINCRLHSKFDGGKYGIISRMVANNTTILGYNIVKHVLQHNYNR